MSFVDRFLDWAYNGLLENEPAQQYLLGRGISPEQWEKHKLGFVHGEFDVDPNSDPGHSSICSDWDKKHIWCDSCHYRSWSATWERTDESEHKEKNVGRRIVGSIVFPLTSYAGTSVGFQVRSIIEKSYDTFAIRRRPEGYFFGASAAMESIWSTKEVFLVEGPPDQLIFERLVAPNVLALTTSSVSKLQLKFLRRFVDVVNVCLDLDVAGRNGVSSFIARYGKEFHVRNVKYEHFGIQAKDVGDLWKKLGDERFKRHMLKSCDLPLTK